MIHKEKIIKPLVTVFIPVYNAELYIGECLESIIYQDYKNIEILIINDGSTDASVDIIKKFDDNRIRILNNTENMGLPYTRNRGLLEAKGKYLMLIDSDDICFRDRIEKQVEFMEKNTEVDVVSSRVRKFPVSNIRNLLTFIRDIFSHDLGVDYVKIMLLFNNCIMNPAAMIRMSSIKDINLKYDEKCFIAQDYKLWCDISKYGKIYIMKDRLIKYRVGHMSITKKTTEERKKERYDVIVYIKNNLLDFYEFDLSSDEKNIYNYFFSEELLDNNIEEIFIDKLSLVLHKIVVNNNVKNIFDKKMFINIINNRIINRILKSRLTLLNKIKYITKLYIKKYK